MSARARLRGSWLEVPYAGHDLSRVEVGWRVGDGLARPDSWTPAYLDYSDGERVAKVQAPERLGHAVYVWVRVDGAETSVGRVVA